MIVRQERAVELKRDLYVQLAFTLFGHVVGFDKNKNMLCKSLGFVVSPEGDFYLLSKKSDSIQNMDMNSDILFSLLKEAKSVSDMWDIQVHGKLEIIPSTEIETVKKAKYLFEEKSPYLGSVGFLDLDKDYLLLRLNVSKIFFQNLRDERDGKKPFLLKQL